MQSCNCAKNNPCQDHSPFISYNTNSFYTNEEQSSLSKCKKAKKHKVGHHNNYHWFDKIILTDLNTLIPVNTNKAAFSDINSMENAIQTVLCNNYEKIERKISIFYKFSVCLNAYIMRNNKIGKLCQHISNFKKLFCVKTLGKARKGNEAQKDLGANLW